MPKSMNMSDEPIKSGSAIGFLNLERFLAGRKLELERLAASNGNASKLNALGCLPGTTEQIVEIRGNS